MKRIIAIILSCFVMLFATGCENSVDEYKKVSSYTVEQAPQTPKRTPTSTPKPTPTPTPVSTSIPTPVVTPIPATVITPIPAAAVKSSETQTYSDTVYITESGKKYHRDGCRYLSKSKIEISLEKATNQGYKPCSKCW